MEPPALTIEKMTLEDLPQVMAIENVSFSLPFTENLFRMEMNLDVASLYVARLQGVVVGYIDYWLVGPEMHLITIAVDPKLRRTHIGCSLIEFMIRDARKNKAAEIVLDVRASNQEALGLYAKYGFKQIGLRKKYYHDNDEDALVMELTFHE